MALFGSNNGRDTGGTSAAPPVHMPSGGKRGMFSVIGADVVITGNVSATADLHVDGRIEGDVDCGALVLGTESVVRGAIKAETARIAGAVEGSVHVRQLTVERAARISGDVSYEAIAMETGATINGRLNHIAQQVIPGPAPRTGASAPVLALDNQDRIAGAAD